MLCLIAHRERYIDFLKAIQTEVPAAASSNLSSAEDGAGDGTDGAATQGGDAEKGEIEVDGGADKQDGGGEAEVMTEKEVEVPHSSPEAAKVEEEPPAKPAAVAVKEEPAVKEAPAAKPAGAEAGAAKGGPAAAKLSVDLASLGKGGGLIGDDEDKAFVPQVCASVCLFLYVF